jgi:sulfur-oxidizing protein SoxY
LTLTQAFNSLGTTVGPLLGGALILGVAAAGSDATSEARSVLPDAPMLADNGLLVPLAVQVNSPMTPQNHVTHLYLLSQRNPVTRMAVFHMGPWSGRAELSTRLRLAGSQKVVALARLSDGSFRWRQADVIVTESACVDGS